MGCVSSKDFEQNEYIKKTEHDYKKYEAKSSNEKTYPALSYIFDEEDKITIDAWDSDHNTMLMKIKEAEKNKKITSIILKIIHNKVDDEVAKGLRSLLCTDDRRWTRLEILSKPDNEEMDMDTFYKDVRSKTNEIIVDHLQHLGKEKYFYIRTQGANTSPAIRIVEFNWICDDNGRLDHYRDVEYLNAKRNNTSRPLLNNKSSNVKIEICQERMTETADIVELLEEIQHDKEITKIKFCQFLKGLDSTIIKALVNLISISDRKWISIDFSITLCRCGYDENENQLCTNPQVICEDIIYYLRPLLEPIGERKRFSPRGLSKAGPMWGGIDGTWSEVIRSIVFDWDSHSLEEMQNICAKQHIVY